jgi:hypothetical protein
MVEQGSEWIIPRTSNRRSAAMRPPCAKLLSRIQVSSPFLVGLHRKYQLSLTESATFLRAGVLEEWTNIGAAKRRRVLFWAAKRARPVDPLERLVLLAGRPHLVTTYTCKTDDFLTSVFVLEALRMLSKTHRPDLHVIAAFQRQWEKFSARHAHLTPRVFSRFLQHVPNAMRSSP